MQLPHLTVSVCTFRRLDMLERLLKDVATQETHGRFTFSALVADNDPEGSAEAVARKCAAATGLAVAYCKEPRRNIALVRNKLVEESRGDAVVFIDDDEFPVRGWLASLFETWRKHGVAGILGPVRPHYPDGTPAWLRRGGFFERPEHPTGFVMPWPECRTGNVLLDRNIFPKNEPAFDPKFPNGGEDVDFYRRMSEAGHKFVWCNEAVAYETVPPNRWKRSILLKRALQRGANSSRQPRNRAKNLVKAFVAAPLYACALPFLQLAGHHLFMRYLVKLCDHSGRLLGWAGLYRPSERQM